MFLKAGLLSLVLLLASRVLGVGRESVLAAAFGSTGMADVAIVMLTLPDWLAGVLASGALAYVLLPQWARETAEQRRATQALVAKRIMWGAMGLAVGMAVAHDPLSAWLVPGIPAPLRKAASDAIFWSALAMPAAILAGLWATRLQFERDFVGLYGGNLVVNLALIATLMILIGGGLTTGGSSAHWLGLGLAVAMVLRLSWQFARLRGVNSGCRLDGEVGTSLQGGTALSGRLPAWRVWVWAALGAGMPLVLPFVARTLASGAGEGALANFNYAWKLVELPLVLAIQLVASIAFPAIVRAHATQAADGDGLVVQRMAPTIRYALVLAWMLACAAAAGLQVAAPVVASVLFGWGYMQVSALEQIAAWARLGAWGLLPQALLAVGLTVLATVGRMRYAVWAYAVALLVLLCAAAAGATQGTALMTVLNAGFLLAALLSWSALGARALRQWLPLKAMLPPLLTLLTVALVMQLGGVQWLAAPLPSLAKALTSAHWAGLASAAFAAAVVMGVGWWSSSGVRRQVMRS